MGKRLMTFAIIAASLLSAATAIAQTRKSDAQIARESVREELRHGRYPLKPTNLPTGPVYSEIRLKSGQRIYGRIMVRQTDCAIIETPTGSTTVHMTNLVGGTTVRFEKSLPAPVKPGPNIYKKWEWRGGRNFKTELFTLPQNAIFRWSTSGAEYADPGIVVGILDRSGRQIDWFSATDSSRGSSRTTASGSVSLDIFSAGSTVLWIEIPDDG